MSKKSEQQYSVTQTCYVTFYVMANSPEEAAEKAMEMDLEDRRRCSIDSQMYVCNLETGDDLDVETEGME